MTYQGRFFYSHEADVEMESLVEVKRLVQDGTAHKQQRCELSLAGTPQLLRISGCSSQQVGTSMAGGSRMQFRQAGSLPSGYLGPSLPVHGVSQKATLFLSDAKDSSVDSKIASELGASIDFFSVVPSLM